MQLARRGFCCETTTPSGPTVLNVALLNRKKEEQTCSAWIPIGCGSRPVLPRAARFFFHPPPCGRHLLLPAESSGFHLANALSQVVLRLRFAFESVAPGRHFSPVRSPLSLQPPPLLTKTHTHTHAVQITHSSHPSTPSHSVPPALSVPPRRLTHRRPLLLPS